MPLKMVKGSPEQQAAYQAQQGQAFEITEDSLASLFEEEYTGRLIYSYKHTLWYRYDDTVGIWSADGIDLTLHWVREFVRGLNKENQAKYARASVVSSVETLARRAPALARTGEELDADPWLLGTPSGVIDLRTGKPLPPSPDHYVTKRTLVSPSEGTPELWLWFLNEATGGDQDLIGYLQRLCGHCLTGDTREEFLAFFFGHGGNGKGVFLNALHEILHNYARQSSSDAFLESKGDRHPADMAALDGARAVLASESSEGKRWDEQRVKAISGRDIIVARFMRGNFFEFRPQFKLIIASNHKPRITAVDDAWRRRLHLVPFDKTPSHPDPNLKDKLRVEYPQILNWMLDGTEWWAREGLAPPAAVVDATDLYFREEDVVRLWFEECCVADPAATTARRVLYQSFEQWCKGMGHAAKTQHSMTRWFKQHPGFSQNERKSDRPVIGARLRTDAD